LPCGTKKAPGSVGQAARDRFMRIWTPWRQGSRGPTSTPAMTMRDVLHCVCAATYV